MHVTAEAPDSFTHALEFASEELLVGTTDDGLFALDTGNNVWTRAGLAGTTIGKIVWTREAA